LFDILEIAAVFYNRCLLESDKAEFARDYLKKRGVSAETIKKFKLGFAPTGMLLQSALKKNIDIEDIIKTGIITRTKNGSLYEYMSERLVFPIFDAAGKAVAFGGRTLSDQQPKYLNTPETSIYSKSVNLYGLYQTLPTLRRERKIIVLEGYMDVVIPWQFGISGAVAALGTSLTKNHCKLISRYADKVILLFDSDNAGRSAAQRAFENLIEEDSVECSASELPEGVDADEYLNEFGKDKFLQLLDSTSKSAIDFMIDRTMAQININSSESKGKAISILGDFVVKMPNEVVKGDWIKKISQRASVSQQAVINEIKKKKVSKFKAPFGDDGASNKTVPAKQKHLLSLDETVLSCILADKSLADKVSSADFEDERCKKVYDLIAEGFDEARIVNSISEEDAFWFSSLSLKEICGDAQENKIIEDTKAVDEENADISNNDTKAADDIIIKEKFAVALKDLQYRNLNKRRQILKKMISDMGDGKIKRDDLIMNEYNNINTQLKGSRR
jgi:DNA primase